MDCPNRDRRIWCETCGRWATIKCYGRHLPPLHLMREYYDAEENRIVERADWLEWLVATCIAALVIGLVLS